MGLNDYLSKQLQSFNADLKHATSKLSSGPLRPSSAARPKSALPSGRSTPGTPLPSALKPSGPPPKAANEIYSQPANTGVGLQIRTQVVYGIEYLKTKRDTFLPLEDILSYLSKQHEDVSYKRQLYYFLKNDEKVEYNPAGEGSFRFKPLHNIRNSDELLAYLQNQTTATGLSVKELRDGWPDIDDTINALAEKDQLLVTRNKKDEKPRMIWPNDPSLRVKIDPEFVEMWKKIQVPDNHDAIVELLERAGQVPASKNSAPKNNKVVKKEKAKKKARRGGKKTNTHMDEFLRDYSHLGKK
jgi:transcription initiation factor TFIIE subunit beta